MDARERLIFALDVPDADKAAALVDQLRDHVGFFKIGLQLFVAEGPAIVKRLFGDDARQVFLDLKLHDVPATMKGGASSADKLGVTYLTIHGEEGAEGLKTAVSGISGRTKLLCITVLTSVSPEMLARLGVTMSIPELVMLRARIAKEAGCAGIVCSGQETAAIRKELGDELIIVNPGIRPLWEGMQVHDQKRVVTPARAVKNGATHIVVGRPIRDADNPADAAKRIVDEIDSAL